MPSSLFALALLFASASAEIADCGPGAFTITDLSQDPPSTISAGQNVTLTLKYDSFQTVTAGTAKTSLSWNFIPFEPTVEDLCTKIVCPLEPGSHDGSATSTFPSGTTGYIESIVQWFDDLGNLLLCIKSTLTATNAPVKHQHNISAKQISIWHPRRGLAKNE